MNQSDFESKDARISQKHSHFSREKAKKLKAVRISFRVKISWQPHLSYPPLSTLRDQAFTLHQHPQGV